jgi:hypothetical protein
MFASEIRLECQKPRLTKLEHKEVHCEKGTACINRIPVPGQLVECSVHNNLTILTHC